YAKMQLDLDQKKLWLTRAKDGIEKYTEENYDKLSQYEKNIHEKAFSINSNDPFYRQLDVLKYNDDGTAREMKVPKGDVLHQFRQDVDNGKLPTVSWIVSPENFSDHPSAPWYGAWYVSEVMDILTKKPEVWKKTIFILCYDENDGYFDHVPPFVAPNPNDKTTGSVSPGIDAGVEYVTLEQDMKKYQGVHARQGPIGLGYRVPLVIASPWSRGGVVCSEVFDHTSIIQFVEKFVNQKFNKNIEETNISKWRRTVCGDLTSVFKPYHDEKIKKPLLVAKDNFLGSIYNAKFKKDPFGYKNLSEQEIEAVNSRTAGNGIIPEQEKGIRPACALAYQLYADGQLNADKKIVSIKFVAGKEIFGEQSAGAPFNVYVNTGNDVKFRSYAVSAGGSLSDNWQLDDFADSNYHLSLYGPNGFFRELKGNAEDPSLHISIEYSRDKRDAAKLTGNIDVMIESTGDEDRYTVEITDNAYKNGVHTMKPAADKAALKDTLVLDLSKSFGWYDFTVKIRGNETFEKRYAGHVETGKESFTDPLMGGVV
ncbi:MAG: alkaline phosphatase family protein, partial [Bacteroidota bacterium]